MDAPRPRDRNSQLRLAALLLLAVIGYEVVLTRHWIAQVPLLPSRIVELDPDQTPLGFIRPETFAIARSTSPPEVTHANRRTIMEFVSFSTGETVEKRPSIPGVHLTTLPLRSPDETYYDAGNLETVNFDVDTTGNSHDMGMVSMGRIMRYDSLRPTSHPTPDGPQRRLSCYCVDETRFLYLNNESLFCYDSQADRLTWRLSNVASLIHVENDLAIVMRREAEASLPVGLRPALIKLHSGKVIDDFGPSGTFDIIDISPDGRWIAFRASTGLEVWSLESRERLWSKSSGELGVRDLYFSADGQSLENWALNDFGRLLRTRIRITDGQVEVAERTRDANPASVSVMGDRIGSSFAFFHDATAKPHEDPRIHSWLANYLRLPVTPAPHVKTQLIVDLQRGRHVGVVDTMYGWLYTTPDGLGFALTRTDPMKPRQLEFYAMPPRRNWVWLGLRAAGLPAAVLLGAALPGIIRRRRRVHPLNGGGGPDSPSPTM